MKKFYLGNEIKLNRITNEKFFLSADDFSRHAFICGSTGTGKTVLGKIIIEEAAKAGVSAIIIDLKGDLSSLAVPIFDFVPDEIIPWLGSSHSEEEQLIEARALLNKFKQKLKHFDIPIETIRKFRQNTKFNIFTPRSKKGIKFSISELYSPPEDIMDYFKREPEVVTGMIQNIGISLLERLYPEKKSQELTVEQVFLEEIIKKMWIENEVLDGISGIEALIKKIYEIENITIGKLPLNVFFPPDKRMDLLRRMNSLLLGSQRAWFEGIAITQIIRNIFNENQSNISIFNLTELDSFADKSLVVSQIAYSIYNIYRKTNSEHLKLIFYIDEIGGSDNNAFFPPEPFHNIAKPGINLLLRQGRAFGVGALLATQNPGDIDYKGLTNCHTWFIGKLQTEEDRKKILEGISRAEIRIDQAQEIMRDADEGCFLVRARNGKVYTFLERWLYSLHRILGEDDISLLKKSLISREEYIEGHDLLKNSKFEEAIKFFKNRIMNEPHESGNYSALSHAYFSLNMIDEAIEVLKSAEDKLPSTEEIHLELGKLFVKKGDYSTAREYFRSCIKQNPENDRALFACAKTELFFMELKNALDLIILATRYNYQQMDYWILKSEILMKMGKYKSAIEAVNTALEFKPDDSKVLCLKALLLLKSGNIKESENIINTVKDEISDFHVVKALLEKDIHRKEEELKKAVEFSDNSVNAYIEMSRFLLDFNRLDEAVKYINKALEKEPYNPDFWFLKSSIFFEQGQIKAALMCIDKAINLKKTSEFLKLKADILVKKGDINDAIKMYKHALKLTSDDISIYIRLSKILIENSPEEALELVKKALDMKKNTDLFVLKSKTLLRLNFPKEALESIDKAIELNPDLISLYKFKSDIYKNSGNYEKAIENYKKISEKFGVNAELFYEIANCYMMQKKFFEALKVCDKGLEKFSKNMKLWEMLKKVYKALGEDDKVLYCESKIKEISAKDE